MLDPLAIEQAINRNDAVTLAALIKQQNLSIDDNRIVANQEQVTEAYMFWDRRQIIKKILLNS